MVWLAGALLAQIALTLFVGVLLGRERVAAVKSRAVRASDIALSNQSWPDDAKKVSNNFSNLFETPVLFYALVLLALHLGANSHLMAILAWLFVLLRLAHTIVHTTSNKINLRFSIFLASMVVLMVMTVLLALKLLFGLSI